MEPPRDRPDSLSQFVRDTIRKRGVSGYELADLCGVHRSNINRFINGQTDLSLRTAEAVFRAIGLCVTDAPFAPDVLETARIVAAYRNESMGDLLSNLLRPTLAELEREEVARRSRGVAAGQEEGGVE